MNTTETKPIKLSFPWSLYFEQLFSKDTYVRFINPWSFWREYRIKHLESCRELNTVQYLESCYQLQWRSRKLPHGEISRNLIETSIPIGSADRQMLNIIFIPQASIELKYRGVTYQTKKIVTVKINSVSIDPNLLKSNNLAQQVNYNNTNTPEIFGGN